MNVLDLFSGIGGFSLGLEQAGFNTVSFCEVDTKCQTVLKQHWPKIPIFSDIHELHISKGDYDVICGGFPCQDISVASQTKTGLKGKRSGLWTEFHRLIKEGEPNYVIIENVANLRSKGLGVVLKNLWEIGYDTEWHIIPASFLGYPHMRERLWIIAYPYRTRPQGCILQQSSLPSSIKQKVAEFANDSIRQGAHYPSFSEFIRMDYGFSEKLDKNRLSQLGNSLIPEIVKYIGLAIKHDSRLS